MSVAVSVNSNLLQLLVTHVGQHIQTDLEEGNDAGGDVNTTTNKQRNRDMSNKHKVTRLFLPAAFDNLHWASDL